MVRFQVRAHTQLGESISLVGSCPELGSWDILNRISLETDSGHYPLWWVDVAIDSAMADTIRYKYVRNHSDGYGEWEGWGWDRWIPVEPDLPPITVDDGWLGVIQPWPYGYFQNPIPQLPPPKGKDSLQVVVIGSSVALGCNAWLLRGWAWRLQQVLYDQFQHQLVNLAEIGGTVTSTIARYPILVTPTKPDVVIISLSLGNEGLAHCASHHRRAVQRRFESGILQLVEMTQQLGARPILGSVYPNGDYTAEHGWLLRDTHERMVSWGIPLFNWLDALDDGQGRWQPGTGMDGAHPNTEGHRRMFEVIDLSLFQRNRNEFYQGLLPQTPSLEISVYQDGDFQILAYPTEKRLRVINPSPYPYTIAPYCDNLQSALRSVFQTHPQFVPGVYITTPSSGLVPSTVGIQPDGSIPVTLEIPPHTDQTYDSAIHFFAPKRAHILFYDGHLALLKETEQTLRVINESDHDYNIQPMWSEVRQALTLMPSGVYSDPLAPDAPFRTLMVGDQGLESRVKVSPQSSIVFQYQCPLDAIQRVAILPLGDRCAVRMMLYKMEYDGPAFPFDLTRTTNLGDVADMIAHDFHDMWNPALLHYNPTAGRIYHSRWSGLSFAHEVESTDDPVHQMQPIFDRMRKRYSARAQRFGYTLHHCDRVLFIRTGVADRRQVVDLMAKLQLRCLNKPFQLLLLSPQNTDEFVDLPHVLHYDLEFNPDQMYADLGHWLYCTSVMQDILHHLGISSNNLFWCPPSPPLELPLWNRHHPINR